jgi:hypothetical protein
MRPDRQRFLPGLEPTQRPTAPYFWPDPRSIEDILGYEHQPPFDEVLRSSRAVIGIVAAPGPHSVERLRTWLQSNEKLNASIIVAVYPTCGTRSETMREFVALAHDYGERLKIRVSSIDRVTARPTSVFYFQTQGTETPHVALTPTEDLGADQEDRLKLNLVCRIDAAATRALANTLEYEWAESVDLDEPGVADIPHLVLPQATEEARRMWEQYRQAWVRRREPPKLNFDPETGMVTRLAADGSPEPTIFEESGVEVPSLLAEGLSRVYEKGHLITVDKSSRVPPLDAPVNPRVLGDEAEREAGTIKRTVAVRISIFSPSDLKGLERLRKAPTALLQYFTFALHDGVRWMPDAARPLFLEELDRIAAEGHDTIRRIVKGDTRAFVASKREILERDLAKMLSDLGRETVVTASMTDEVLQVLESRLQTGQRLSFAPRFSFSSIQMASRSESEPEDWGQEANFLLEIAEFPRVMATSPRMQRGCPIPAWDLVQAMDVLGDPFVPEFNNRLAESSALAEIELLTDIRKAEISPLERCRLVWSLLKGATNEDVRQDLEDAQRRAAAEGA